MTTTGPQPANGAPAPRDRHRARLLHRLVGTAVLGAVLVGWGAVAASAAPSPSATRNPDGSVSVTVPAEQVERFCTETGPRALGRAEAWVERVRGDAETRGSAAWVRARAERAQDAGRARAAERLRERADRAERRIERLVERTDRLRERLTVLCAGSAGS